LRIDSGIIGMDSARSYASETKRNFTLERKTYGGILERREGNLSFRGMLMGENQEEAVEEDEGTKTEGNDLSQGTVIPMWNGIRTARTTPISDRNELEMIDKIKQQCIKFLLELFGLRDKYEKEYQNMTSLSETSAEGTQLQMPTTTITTGLYQEYYMEQETTSFSTTGSVVTADGRTLQFNLEVEMSRSFQQTYIEGYQTIDYNSNLCDPLVINLDGNIADVSDQKFLFDIDADGILDRVSQLGDKSGYLALDKDGDGKINDGNELFGAQSGNGFQDLAQYDDDGNGWIDEGDDIWKKLLIWSKDASGKDRLYHVSEKGVGAICLQNQTTDFSLNSLRNNQMNGRLRQTGIFLYENGNVGTIQHVDLVKESIYG